VIISKRIGPQHPVVTNAVGMTAGAAVLLLAAVVAGETFALPADGETQLAVLYLVAATVALFLAMLYVVQRWTASATAYVFVLMPIVALIVGALIADEEITATTILGGTVVFAGVYLGALPGRPEPRLDFPARQPAGGNAEETDCLFCCALALCARERGGAIFGDLSVRDPTLKVNARDRAGRYTTAAGLGATSSSGARSTGSTPDEPARRAAGFRMDYSGGWKAQEPELLALAPGRVRTLRRPGTAVPRRRLQGARRDVLGAAGMAAEPADAGLRAVDGEAARRRAPRLALER
jgi:hypothetical protein